MYCLATDFHFNILNNVAVAYFIFFILLQWYNIVIIIASNLRLTNDRARLTSPTFAATEGECLEFYYHMQVSISVTLHIKTIKDEANFTMWVDAID